MPSNAREVPGAYWCLRSSRGNAEGWGGLPEGVKSEANTEITLSEISESNAEMISINRERLTGLAAL